MLETCLYYQPFLYLPQMKFVPVDHTHFQNKFFWGFLLFFYFFSYGFPQFFRLMVIQGISWLTEEDNCLNSGANPKLSINIGQMKLNRTLRYTKQDSDLLVAIAFP